MPETVPPWKFWHPLPLWQVFLIGFVAQIVCLIPVIALREGAGIPVPTAVGSGLGGIAMLIGVRWFAQRRLAAGK